jgi:hypothetical protein
MTNNGFDEPLEEYEDIDEDELFYELDDDRRAELNEMVGLKVLGIELWEESIVDEEEDQPPSAEERVFVDCDLYLEDNVAIELYVASVYPDPDGEPVIGVDAIFAAVGRLADDHLELIDFGDADEEEGGLALAFGIGDEVKTVLVAQAWMVSDWEPDEDEEAEDEED